MKRTATYIVALLVMALAMPSFAQKKKIAVLGLDDGSIQDRWWGNDFSPGSGLSDMLVTALVNGKKFTVYEREQIQAVMNELGFQASGMVDESSAKQLGKTAGVDYLVTGKVTEFTIREEKIGGKGLKLGGLKGASVSTTKASCGLDVRVIDVETGEVVAAVSAVGKEDKKGVSVDLKNLGELSMDSEDFQNSLLGIASRKAVEEIAAKLGEELGVNYATIVKVSGSEVMLDYTKDDVKVGDVLTVFRLGEEIELPSGKKIREEEEVGEIKISEVNADYSKATIVKGSIEKNDIARLKKE